MGFTIHISFIRMVAILANISLPVIAVLVAADTCYILMMRSETLPSGDISRLRPRVVFLFFGDIQRFFHVQCLLGWETSVREWVVSVTNRKGLTKQININIHVRRWCGKKRQSDIVNDTYDWLEQSPDTQNWAYIFLPLICGWYWILVISVPEINRRYTSYRCSVLSDDTFLMIVVLSMSLCLWFYLSVVLWIYPYNQSFIWSCRLVFNGGGCTILVENSALLA